MHQMKTNTPFFLGAITLSVLILLPLLFHLNIFAQQQISSVWKNYTDNDLKISFEFPSNWTIIKKDTRFDYGQDVNASNGLNSFGVSILIPNDFTTSTLKPFTEFWNSEFVSSNSSHNIKNIKAFNPYTYPIGNKPAISALYVMNDTSGKQITKQIFFIKQGNVIYEITYTDISDRFNSIESQNIVNHILKSFVLLNPHDTQIRVQHLISQLTNVSLPGAGPLGSSKTPITIVEFGDYQCPYCASFNKSVKNNLTSNYINKGLVKLQFKNLLVNDLAKDKLSSLAAEASYCAAEQNKYWPYHDELYKNDKGENTGWVSINSLNNFAKNVDMPNMKQFSSCVLSHKYNPIVIKNDLFAKSIGLNATPTFLLIKPESTKIAIVQGLQSYSAFKNIIDNLLLLR